MRYAHKTATISGGSKTSPTDRKTRMGAKARPLPKVVLALLFTAVMALSSYVFVIPRQAASAANVYDWQDTAGPGYGDARSLLYDQQRGVLYRGTGGRGVWRYKEGQWSSLGGPFNASYVYAFALDHDHSLLYVGASGGGVCSYNIKEGEWQDTGMGGYGVSCLVLDPARDMLYAGTYGNSVWRYDISSGSWSSMAISGAASGVVDSLALDGSDNVLYAGVRIDGVWICENPDTSSAWKDTGGGVGNLTVPSQYFSHSEGMLYAGTSSGVWRYSPKDGNWEDISWNMVSQGVSGITCDEAKGILYAALSNSVWRCVLADKAWNDMSGNLGNKITNCLAPGPDFEELYVGTHFFGVMRCENPETSSDWSDTGPAFSNWMVYDVACDEENGRLFAGPANFDVWMHDPSTSPEWSSMGPTGTRGIECLSYDALHDRLYAGTPGYNVWRYDFKTSSWSDIGCGSTYGYVGSLAHDPAHDLLYAGMGPAGVSRYDPGSNGWTPLAGGYGFIEDIAYDSRHDRLYAGDLDGRVWMCSDPGGSGYRWREITGGHSFQSVRALAYDVNRDMLYIGTMLHGVWRYDPSREEWADIGGPLSESTVARLCCVGGRLLYAAPVGRGVWACENPAGSPAWSDTGGELGDRDVYALAYDRASRKLYAGTNGYGVWETDITFPLAEEIDPAEGVPGEEVIIKGSNFGAERGGSRVYFGQVETTQYLYWSDTEIRCVVPELPKGPVEVRVQTAGGTSVALDYDVLCVIDARVASGKGRVQPAEQRVRKGASASVDMIPQAGYHLDSIKDNGATAAIADPFVIQDVQEDHHIEVTFAINRYTVRASVSGGHGAVSPASQTVDWGGTAAIDLLPEQGFHVASIKDNGTPSAVADPYIIEGVREDHEVVVEFAPDAVPATTWYLAEGCTQGDFETWVLVQNPNPGPVTVDLTFMTATGPEPGPQDFEIPANSRHSFRVNDYVSSWDVSTRVEADGGEVICERAMYDLSRTWAHDSIGFSR